MALSEVPQRLSVEEIFDQIDAQTPMAKEIETLTDELYPELDLGKIILDPDVQKAIDESIIEG